MIGVPAPALAAPADRGAAGGAAVAFCLACAGFALAPVLAPLSPPTFVPPVLAPAAAGLALAALARWLFPGPFAAERLAVRRSRATLLLGVSLLALWGLLFALGRVPPDEAGRAPWPAAPPLLVALSFLCGGFVLAEALTRSAGGTVRACARLFAGAALAAAAAPPLLALIGPHAVVAILGAAAALASLHPPAGMSWRRRALPLVVAGLGLALAAATAAGALVEPRYAGGRHVDGVRLDLREGASRLLIHALGDAEVRAAVAVGPAFGGALPELVGVVTDDGRRSAVARLSPGGEPAWARSSLFALAYRLRERPAALLLGAGGGADIQVALAAGAGAVRAVEGDPLVVHAVQENLGGFSGRPYALAGVEAVVEGARAHLQRDNRRYDVVFAAGEEKTLLTREGIDAALDRLGTGGLLAIARVDVGAPLLRLAATARATLEARGSPAPSAHFFAAAAGGTALLIVKATLFTVGEVVFLERACQGAGFAVLYSPLHPGGDALSGLFEAQDPGAAAAGLEGDVAPASDDRPRAASFLHARELLRPGAPPGAGPVDRALFAARDRTAAFAVAALAVLLLPLAARPGTAPAPRGASWAAAAFFAALGLGLAVTGTLLFESLGPLTGGAGRAAGVSLAAFLAAAAFGVRRGAARAGSPAALRRRLALLTIALLIATATLPLAVEAGLSAPAAARLLVAAAAAGLLGFLAAPPLALGLACAAARGEDDARRAWSVAAAFAALGAAGALGAAAIFGVTGAMIAGPACFLAAGALADLL